MRIFLLICRVVVGSLFIVSGLIKANDPLGFSYKLKEYFEEGALNLPGLDQYALALAILACTAEVVLGFAVLFGGRMKLATACLLLLTVFFGWLTAYTATCDPNGTYNVIMNGETVAKPLQCVTDCGCFGDAMKGSMGRSLTPWESFMKDAILFVLILPIFFASWFRKPGIAQNTSAQDGVFLSLALALTAFFCWVFAWWFPLLFAFIGFAGYMAIKRRWPTAKGEWFTAIWITVISLTFIYRCYNHLPLRDYRPFAVGKSIPEGMAVPEGAPVDVYETQLIYKNKLSGKDSTFTVNNYPWRDSLTWEHDTTINTLKVRGYEPPIHDFKLTDQDGVDVTQDILEADQPVLLIIAKTITEASTACQPRINALVKEAFNKGWYVYGVTASSYSDVEEFRHTYDNAFDYLLCDETVLKTMIRSNPGIMVLNSGTVKGLWHCNDTPTFPEAEAVVK